MLNANFNTPVLQDQGAQTLKAMVGADSTVTITTPASGEVRIQSPLVTLRASKAEVAREGRVVTVKIKS